MTDLLPSFAADLVQVLHDLTVAARNVVLPAAAPRVLIVPGLPGSTLIRRGVLADDTLWFSPAGVFAGRLAELAYDPAAPPLDPDGVISFVYFQLQLRLRCAGFDAAFHAFDWRRSLRELGAELAQRVADEKREVHLVGHSFGALVARAAARVGAPNLGKVIMLGPPLQGTFAAVQALRGNHWALRLLAAFDPARSAPELAAQVVSTWPSVYEQIPTRAVLGGSSLYHPSAWPATGPGPRPELLERVPAVYEWLAEARGQFVTIAGYGIATVDGVALDDRGFCYRGSTDGDGWVPVSWTGLDGYPCYYASTAHIGMTNHQLVIGAVEDILATGTTARLPTQCPHVAVASQCGADCDELPPPFGGRKGPALTEEDLRNALAQISGAFDRS